MITRLFFAIIYIIVDLVYVASSKPVYDAVVKRIQGAPIAPITGLGGYAVVLLTYTCMALGWFVLAAGTIDNWPASLPVYFRGALSGFVFGLACIGTFNLTSHLMFKNYDLAIVARDMTWGIGWATLVTTLYACFRG